MRLREIGDQEALPALETQVTLQAISHIVAQALGKIDAEFKILRGEVGKSLEMLANRFDSKLTTISKKINYLEIIQGELIGKQKPIMFRQSLSSKVNTLEADQDRIHEECTRLKVQNDKLQRTIKSLIKLVGTT